MRCLSITSGKGGVGKTNVAVNLAFTFANRGKRVLLLDADLGLANIDVLLGLQTQGTLSDVLTDGKTLAQILHRVRPNLDLLPANSGVLRLERLSSQERAGLATELDALSEGYDILIIDTGAGIGDNVLFFNDLADQVLLVTVPEPTALTDTYAMIKVLSRNYRVETMSVVVNQAATEAAATAVHDKLMEVSRKFLGVEVGLAGYLPTDPAVGTSVKARMAAMVHNPNSAFARGIRLLASSLEQSLGDDGPARTRSFWREWMALNQRTPTIAPTVPLAQEGSKP